MFLSCFQIWKKKLFFYFLFLFVMMDCCDDGAATERSVSVEDRLMCDYEELLTLLPPPLYSPSHEEHLANRFS